MASSERRFRLISLIQTRSIHRDGTAFPPLPPTSEESLNLSADSDTAHCIQYVQCMGIIHSFKRDINMRFRPGFLMPMAFSRPARNDIPVPVKVKKNASTTAEPVETAKNSQRRHERNKPASGPGILPPQIEARTRPKQFDIEFKALIKNHSKT
jgi:hypothetical protein